MGLFDNFASSGDTSGLSTSEQLADVQRRRQLAQALQARGQQGPGLIQAGPFAVGGGIGGGLAGLAQILGGALADQSLGKQETGLKKQAGSERADALRAMMGGDMGATPPPMPQQPSAPTDNTPPILRPQTPPGQGNVGVGTDGMPEVTVNATRPPGTPAAPGMGPGATPPAIDPAATRRAAALRYAMGMGPDKQEVLLGQLAAQELQPRPLIKFNADEGFADAISGKVVKAAGEKPNDELAKLTDDLRRKLISQEDFDARRAMMTSQGITWEDNGADKIPLNSKTGQPVPGVKPIHKQMTPSERHNAEMFNDKTGEMLGALSALGVSLPAGYRSKEQQHATLQSLLDRNPGKTPDEIAAGVKSGQLLFTGEMAAANVAGKSVGKVRVGEAELQEFAPAALQASQAVPRGSFVPFNRLAQLVDSKISDPALRNFKIRTNALLNAYDQVAARAGTDVGKRAETHALLETADSPEAYAAGVRAFMDEARLAEKAAKRAINPDADLNGPAEGGAGGGGGQTTKVIGGVTYVNVDGKWFQQ